MIEAGQSGHGSSIEIFPVRGLPEIQPGTSLGVEIASRYDLAHADIVAISQKVVSKAEGRLVSLEEVVPGAQARRLAERTEKDPRLVELILTESRSVLRAEGSVLITETHHGHICANAGIDSSNVPGESRVALLPKDPDGSARRIRAELASAAITKRLSPVPAVLISDSFGRPWRLGQSEVAIGCAGIRVLDDWRGRTDSGGQLLTATAIAAADQLAAAADLARDKTSRTPVVVIRGRGDLVTPEDGPGATALLRPAAEDLFR